MGWKRTRMPFIEPHWFSACLRTSEVADFGTLAKRTKREVEGSGEEWKSRARYGSDGVEGV